MNDYDPVAKVHDALLKLQENPPEHWGLNGSIQEIRVPCEEPEARLSQKLGINFQVLVTPTEPLREYVKVRGEDRWIIKETKPDIGVALEVVNEKGVPCAPRSSRKRGLRYLIEQVKVFASDDLPKVIRRVVDSINRFISTLRRHSESRLSWKRSGDRQMRHAYFRTSHTLVIPKYWDDGKMSLSKV